MGKVVVRYFFFVPLIPAPMQEKLKQRQAREPKLASQLYFYKCQRESLVTREYLTPESSSVLL